MGERIKSGFKLPEWAKTIAARAFMAIVAAGFFVWNTTVENKKDIEAMQKQMEVLAKADDRHELSIGQLQGDVRRIERDTEESSRKSISKLDQLLAYLGRGKK